MANEQEDCLVAIDELEGGLSAEQPSAGRHGVRARSVRGRRARAGRRSTVRRHVAAGATTRKPTASGLLWHARCKWATALRRKGLTPRRALCCAAMQDGEHPLGVNGSSALIGQPAQHGLLRAATMNMHRTAKDAAIAGSFIARVEIAVTVS